MKQGSFGRHSLTRTLDRRGVQSFKQQFTITFIINGAGKSEGKPIVI